MLTDFEAYMHRDTPAENSAVITANAAQKGKTPHYKQRNFHSGSASTNRPTSPGGTKKIVCQFCEKPGHTAKVCYKIHGYPPKSGFKPSAHNAQIAPTTANTNWILDSGASHHITNNLEQLHLSEPYHGTDQLLVGNGAALPISHTGKHNITTPSHTLQLDNVLHVPNISNKLLSISQLCNTNPISVEFFANYFLVKDLRTQVPLLKGPLKDGLYHLSSALPPKAFLSSTPSPWHHILGHPSSRIQQHLTSALQIKDSSASPCISCDCSKSHKLSFSKSSICSSRPLEIIYTDVWGPAPIRSLDGFLYYLVLVDHFTKYIWLYPLRNKSDVSIIFPKFKTIVEKYFNLQINSVHSDNGGEFIKLRPFFAHHGISHYTSPPHTPEKNSPAERRHRHLVETGRALLHHANLPPSFWSFAFLTITYLINRLPTPLLNMSTPFSLLHKTKPNYFHLHSFGCLCFPWLRPYTNHKLQPRSQPCILVGYSPSQYAYLCLDPISNKVYTSRHVKFHDSIFPYTSLTANSTKSVPTPSTAHESLHTLIPLSTQPHDISLHASNASESAPLPVPPAAANSAPVTTSTKSSHPSTSEPTQPPPPIQPVPTNHQHPMTTRSKNGIFKPKKRLFTATKHPLPENLEPSSVREAMKYPHWRQAMAEEFDALLRNGTWSLVPAPKDHNVVGCRWLFRIKRNPDGSISRFKARLVAKGYTQTPGYDFHETFAPVVRPQTVKVILTIALAKLWKMHQLDVNNAFLQGTIDETIFMVQPPGFKHPQHPDFVCKLHKAIYGLRQAPRAWHEALKSFITDYGFSTSLSDPSLFIYSKHNVTAYFLVYVDDLLLTGNDDNFLASFIHGLSSRFSLKNLGTPHYFLGVELVQHNSGLLLSQHKFIRDILERFDMEGAKPAPTPLSSTAILKLADGSPHTDATHYRRIIGALQYLNMTRPDLSFAINKLSQFMHQPTSTHLQHLKRLLRYLKSTINYGLLLQKSAKFELVTFSDADWGGNMDDRTSTSAYISFFGGNPISWSSKKQKTVARSSTEAEYRAVASAAAEVLWLKNLLHELHIPLSRQPLLLCDNIGATYLCSNPVNHSRMKHISLDYHFVREQVQSKQIQVSHVSTKDQVADLLTKPLPQLKFEDFRYKMKVTNGDFILRGHISSDGATLHSA